MIRTVALGAAAALAGLTAAGAESLTYSPTNPSFGGNPFYADYYLSLANAQKQFEAPSRSFERDPFADFQDTLSRRLLSELSRDITEAIFGEAAQDSGSFNVGDTVVEFDHVGDEIVINLSDGVNETVITLPVVAP